MTARSTAGFLRRDEDDSGMGFASLLCRQVGELFGDLRRVWRHSGRRGAPLASAMVTFHWAMIRGRSGDDTVRQLTVHLGETSARCVIRNTLSDLFVLREVFVHRVYDFPYERHLGPIRRVLDVGSNVGLSPLYFGSRFPTAAVACVEPTAENIAMIGCNRSANGYDWWVTRAAVASRAGMVTLFASDWSASNSTSAAVSEARRSAAHRPEHRLQPRQVTVPAITMSGLLANLGWADDVDILKMDIEGAEEAVLLQGEPDWLDGVGILVIDIHHKYVPRVAIVEVLRARGFESAAEHGPHAAVFLSPRAKAAPGGGS